MFVRHTRHSKVIAILQYILVLLDETGRNANCSDFIRSFLGFLHTPSDFTITFRMIFRFSGRPYNNFFSPFYFSFTGRT